MTTPHPTLERLNLLRQVSFAAKLDESILRALAVIAVPLDRPAGAVIQLEGEPADAMYVVASGQVKVSRLGANGREQVLRVATAGQHFNSVPLFDGGPCPANAEALTDVTLLAFPHEAMCRVIETHSPLATALLADFARQLRQLVNLVDDLALHTVQGRLAALLLRQAEAAERGEVTRSLTQAEMASHLGTVREMIGRTLKSFEALGLVSVERGTIAIRDRAGLAEQAEA
jgi:CRP-like cAMP-binding protein